MNIPISTESLTMLGTLVLRQYHLDGVLGSYISQEQVHRVVGCAQVQG